MPHKRPTYQPDDELSVQQIADYFGIGLRAASGLVERENFPNARRLNPSNPKSPHLVPFSDVLAYEKIKSARAQARKAKARA